MKFEFAQRTPSIEIGDKEYTIAVDDPATRDSYDAFIEYLSELGSGQKTANNVDLQTRLNAFFEAMFGEKNAAEIAKAGNLDVYNSMRLATAIVKVFSDAAQSVSIDSILSEFDMA